MRLGLLGAGTLLFFVSQVLANELEKAEFQECLQRDEQEQCVSLLQHLRASSDGSSHRRSEPSPWEGNEPATFDNFKEVKDYSGAGRDKGAKQRVTVVHKVTVEPVESAGDAVLPPPELAHVLPGVPKWNNSKCPAFWEIQSDRVQDSFSINDIKGMYYDLGVRDQSFLSFCPVMPRCITVHNKAGENCGTRFIDQKLTMECVGACTHQNFKYNETGFPGVFNATWYQNTWWFLPKDAFAGIVFQKIIVDYEPGEHGWHITFSCMEFLGHVVYAGINYLSKTKTHEAFKKIDCAARKRGLGLWLDSFATGLQKVDHHKCKNEAY